MLPPNIEKIIVNKSWVSRLRDGSGLVCNLYHGEPDDLFTHHEAGLETGGHGVFAKVLIFNVHHCIVKIGVKGLAQWPRWA